MLRMIKPTGMFSIGNRVMVKSGPWKGAVGFIRESDISKPGCCTLGQVINGDGETISEPIQVARGIVVAAD